MRRAKILAYTYQSAPWRRTSGDDVRIDTILKYLSRGKLLYAFTLGLDGKNQTVRRERILYLVQPRPVYSLLSKIFNWKNHYDLNPLAKATLYIDEIVLALRLARMEKTAMYIFGSMTLMPAFLKVFGYKGKIIYDPLSNYAQTLYLRSKKSLSETLKYGLYLALHKLSLKASNAVIYPSEIDSTNAIRMFKKELFGKNVTVMPNPYPICYKNLEEYQRLRQTRAQDKPHYILLAGGKGQNNREAVEITLKAFRKIARFTNDYVLIITGPWNEYTNRTPPNTVLTGYVDETELKRLLAVSDIGLVPVFSHVAGTFLKTLAYVAAGLDIITTIHGLFGLDIKEITKRSTIHLIKTENEFIEKIISTAKTPKQVRAPYLCHENENKYYITSGHEEYENK